MRLCGKGFLDVYSRSLHNGATKKDTRSSKVPFFACPTFSPIFFGTFESKFSLFSSLSPVHKAKVHDFVLGSEECDYAHIIRMTILNVRSRNVDAIVETLQTDYNCNQVQLTTNIVDSLLQNFGDDWKSALGFFQWAGSRPGYKHTPYACNKMVDLLGKMKQMDPMWDLVEKLQSGGFLTLETVGKIMRRLAGAGRWRDAVSFFDDLGNMGFTKGTESMNLLLDTLCKEKKVKAAREVFLELKAYIPADAYTFNIFVHGWCSIRKIEEAIWTIQEMKGYGFSPSVITYSTILGAYCNQCNFDKVYELLDEMVAEGCPPNVVSYTIIISSLAKPRYVKEVQNVVNRMKSSGCKPDARFYNTLINTLGKAGQLEDAFHIFDAEMEKNGVNPDLSTYNTMVSIFCEHDQEQDALSVLKEMECSSFKPVLQTYYPLIKLYFRMGKLDDQLKSFLGDITTKHHLSLDLDAYTLLIHGFCGAGKVEFAYLLFDEMVEQEIIPRIHTCRLLMDLVAQKNMIVAVENIRSLMSRSKFIGSNR